MNKYQSCGLDYELIKDSFVDLEAYEESLNFYLKDEDFFNLRSYLADCDWAMAKDALKGLFVLAQELKVMPLYFELVELYGDLLEEEYQDIESKYQEIIRIHRLLKENFND